MKVLAIDPGYDRLGVALLERVDNADAVLYSNCIETDKTATLPERLHVTGEAIAALLAEHQPTHLAIETLFFNKNQKTAIGVAQMRGICLYLGQAAACTIAEYGPQEIKIAVTGYGNSDKQAVMAMVPRLASGVPEQALDDEYDAIAVGLTALAHYRA